MMDAAMERQVTRVLDAFRQAAAKHWGPELPTSVGPEREQKPRTRSESPKRQRARDFLKANPRALNEDIAHATGAGGKIIADVRRELKIRSPMRGSEKRNRVVEAFEANPGASGAEIAKLAGVSERYAQDIIRRLKWEKGRNNDAG